MKCKDCTYYWKMATPEHGVCSLVNNMFPTEAENNCKFLRETPLICMDCDRFGIDDACFTVKAEDDATHCGGFIPKGDTKIYDGLFELLKIGKYSREHIDELLSQFESERVFIFIKEHQNEE